MGNVECHGNGVSAVRHQLVITLGSRGSNGVGSRRHWHGGQAKGGSKISTNTSQALSGIKNGVWSQQGHRQRRRRGYRTDGASETIMSANG